MRTFVASEKCVQRNLFADYLSYSAGIDLIFILTRIFGTFLFNCFIFRVLRVQCSSFISFSVGTLQRPKAGSRGTRLACKKHGHKWCVDIWRQFHPTQETLVFIESHWFFEPKKHVYNVYNIYTSGNHLEFLDTPPEMTDQSAPRWNAQRTHDKHFWQSHKTNKKQQ